MARKRDINQTIRRAAAPALALVIVAVFAGYALIGSNGLLAWSDYHDRIDVKKQELARLQQERARLDNQVKLLNPSNVDPDYADELVRRKTGQVRSDEFIMPLDKDK